MKTISLALQNHLNGELTTLAEIIKITRQDGLVKAFTNHDEDLVVGGLLYKADGSFSSGAMKNQTNLKTNDYEVEGVLESGEITQEDIKKGLYDHAEIEVSVVNWQAPDQGTLLLRRGWLGEVVCRGGSYIASFRGMQDLLQRRVGEIYTPECRYDLGDARCAVACAALKVQGSVTAVEDAAHFVDTSRGEAEGFFAYGKLTWLSGANEGQSMEVQAFDATLKRFSLWLPMGAEIAVGDTYEVVPGCDKRFATCCTKFSNGTNFGGFPHLPGLSKILQYPESS